MVNYGKLKMRKVGGIDLSPNKCEKHENGKNYSLTYEVDRSGKNRYY